MRFIPPPSAARIAEAKKAYQSGRDANGWFVSREDDVEEIDRDEEEGSVTVNTENYEWDTERCAIDDCSTEDGDCDGPMTHFVLNEDSFPCGCLCRKHSKEFVAGKLRKYKKYINEKFDGDVSVSEIYCDTCRKILWHPDENDDCTFLFRERYFGPRCASCSAEARTLDAMRQHTATMERLLAAMIVSPAGKATAIALADAPGTHGMLKMFEVDATEAAWRMAGSQFTKLAKDPILALLSRHLGPDDETFRARSAAFLDTEIGTAILSGLLSAGLCALPLPPNDVSQRLSRELRVRSLASVGDTVADLLMGPLREVATTYLRGNPAADEVPLSLKSTAEPVPMMAPVVKAPVAKNTKRSVTKEARR